MRHTGTGYYVEKKVKDADDYVSRKIKMLEEQAERVQQLIGTRQRRACGCSVCECGAECPVADLCAIQAGAGRAWSRWWALCR